MELGMRVLCTAADAAGNDGEREKYTSKGFCDGFGLIFSDFGQFAKKEKYSTGLGGWREWVRPAMCAADSTRFTRMYTLCAIMPIFEHLKFGANAAFNLPPTHSLKL